MRYLLCHFFSPLFRRNRSGVKLFANFFLPHRNNRTFGATENARHENTGRSKMQGWKMRDMNLRHQIAGVENARHENAGPNCRGGKCGKS